MKHKWTHWRRYWLVNMLSFLFPKSIKVITGEVLTEALHPEFGWVWRDEEQGGKAIAQAYSDGFRDCAALTKDLLEEVEKVDG